jgi:phosphoenolpyruvate carboxykinase (GTP)
VPTPQSLDTDGLDISDDQLATLLRVDDDVWREEADAIATYYDQFGDYMPVALMHECDGLARAVAVRPTLANAGRTVIK